jgi:hypothetical protein
MTGTAKSPIERLLQRHAEQRLGDDFVAGLALYTGQQALSFGPRLRAMPVSALWEVPPPA